MAGGAGGRRLGSGAAVAADPAHRGRAWVLARVPVAVWAVWDGEDLVGVYAEQSTARADAAVLQRDAVRAGLRGLSVDCLPLQVFTESQHTRR
jgi:hypothetical protein